MPLRYCYLHSVFGHNILVESLARDMIIELESPLKMPSCNEDEFVRYGSSENFIPYTFAE